MEFKIDDKGLEASAFIAFVNQVSPRNYEMEKTQKALSKTLNITAYDGTRLVGCLRILSDGYFFGTITELLVLPEYQRHFYSDGEAFGEELPKTLKIVPMSKEEKIPVFGIDGLPCVFKHPRLRFDTPEFRKWDCGYILGSILTMKDLS